MALLAAFVLSGRGFGVSGAFASGAGREWIRVEVLGIALGGFLSARLAGRWRREVEKGPTATRTARLALAFGGGTIMAAGAVLARGCTSGQALTGGALLSVGGWLFLGAAFAAAHLTMLLAPFLRRRLAMSRSLWLALALGGAFGWALERAGLGSARKLAGQFLLTDFTVLKVMFSALVTAMLGVFWCARLGMLDLSQLAVPETFVGPQLLGGAIFGLGFAAAGLCPGTSCVAAATGRGDGLAVVFGFLAGTFAVGWLSALPPAQALFDSGRRGVWTLPDAFDLSYGATVLAVVAFALTAFWCVERWERKRG